MKTMKIYKGRRLFPEEGKISKVVVTANNEPLKHKVYHSPNGFNFGYGGSGPADQDFKFRFVSGWKDEWEITSEEIQNWLDKRGA